MSMLLFVIFFKSAMFGKQRLSCNLNVDDGFGKPGSLSIQKKSEDESMLLVVQDFCVHAALSHYVLAYMIVQFEYAKLQAVITAIACMKIPEGEDVDEIISKRDIDEGDLLNGQEMFSLTTYNDDRDLGGSYFDVSDIAQLSSMDGDSQDDLTNDANFFSIRKILLNKANAAIPIYTTSLSGGIKDLNIIHIFSTYSPIKFIDGIFQDLNLLNKVVYGCDVFPTLTSSSTSGIPGSEMRKLYSPETLSTFQMKFTTENDHEDLSDEKVSAEIMNKTAYQSNLIHRPACNFGATSLFTCIKNFIVVLMCFALVNPAVGVPVLDKGKMVDKDKGKMVDKDGAVYHKFPLLESDWCHNPEQSIDTCPNRDKDMENKVQHCQYMYKCPDGEKIQCLESDIGIVFFCIPEDIRCVKGIGWKVEGIEHRGSDKFVVIKESACPVGFYQSRPSKCYDACKDKHEPLHLIPSAFKIVSLGNNTHPTMLRCKHEDGFYNPKNQSYISFIQGVFQMDFCTNVRDLNPCKSGQMPLYNRTCVNHCSPGYARDDIDFFCKWNGTVNPAGISSSEAGPKKEIEVMKEMEKDDDNEAKLNEEEKDKSYHLVPLYYVIIGFCFVLILIVVILIKVCCFPNRCVPSCAYLQVPGDLTDSNTSSAQSVEDAVEGMVPLAVKDRVPDAENISLNNISTSKDDDDRSDATVDTDSTSENKVDDETFRKEIIDTQTVVKEKISSESSGLKVKKEKKYHNNLFLKVENVGAFNFGSVSSKEDMHVLMKSLYDELQNCKKPEAAVESFFEKMIDSDKIVSKKDEEGGEEKEDILQDVEILTPDFGGNVTSEVDRGAGEEFASPYCKTLTQLVVTFLSEYMKSVGALIYNGEVIGTVFRAGDDYLITAFHVIRKIIDPGDTGQFNYTRIEPENVFINFNASVCETPDYKFRVRHVLSTDTPRLDFTVLQITNRNDDLPKGLKLDKRPGNTQTKTLHGIGYGDPENPFCKVLDNSCPIIPSINTRILDCEKWLHDTNRGLQDQNLPPVAQNGANAGLTRVQYFEAHVPMMGSHPDIVDKGYQGIDRDQHIFSDICLEHRGSGSPFLTSDGIVKGILTYGHPEFYYLLPKIVKASFPSDKRFECILKIEYVYQSILRQDPDLANKLFG